MPSQINFRRKMIFFEGLDKTGKTLLCREVRFAGQHQIPFYDRGFVGRKVFSEFRNECPSVWKYWSCIEQTLIDNRMYAVIFLRASIEAIVRRHLKAGEMCEFTAKEFRTQEQLYIDRMIELKLWGVPVLTIYTDQCTVDEAIEKILVWTELR